MSENVELYKFSVGGTVYGYTNNQTQISESGVDYEPSYVRRAPIKGTGQLARAALEIRLPRNAGVVSQFIQFPPSTVSIAEVYSKEGTDAAVLIYKGRIMNIPREGSEAVVKCESILTSMKQPGLRLKYQARCPYALYDANCTVDKSAFKVVGEITAMNADKTEITVDTFSGVAADYFVGGFIQWGSLPDVRYVVDQSGGTVTLMTPLLDAEVGDDISGFAGCKHTFAVCRDKFSNEKNYGGFVAMPNLNPFGDSPIF